MRIKRILKINYSLLILIHMSAGSNEARCTKRQAEKRAACSETIWLESQMDSGHFFSLLILHVTEQAK